MEARTEYSKYKFQAVNTDEKLASLSQPDTLLSAQYFDNLRRKTLLEPEKRLMLAILEDAINCFQENLLAQSRRRKRLFEEAEEWIVEGGGEWIFTFENICGSLGFNPEYMRQGLLRWKEKKLAQPADVKLSQRKNAGWIVFVNKQNH